MTAVLLFLRKYWVHAAGLVVVVLAGLWLRHAGYQAGWEDAQAEAAEAREAALTAAGERFREELAKRDAELADAQGKVVEVVKWRTKVQTVYEEAVKNDPDCAAWSSEFVRCPLGGLQVNAGPGDREGMPEPAVDPAE